MASELLEKYNDPASKSQARNVLDALMDDVTEQAGSTRERIEATEEEICVKWQMPGGQDMASAKKILLQMLTNLLINHPSQITIVDTKQREWMFEESVDEGGFIKEIEKMSIHLHPIKGKDQKVIRWVSVTKTMTKVPLREWKNNDGFFSGVQESKTYIFPHPFQPQEWETASIGFIKDIHVVHFPKEMVHEHLHQLLQKQEENPPTFQLVSQRISTSDKKASTKAFTIQCLKKDAEKLQKMLTHGAFREAPNQVFVPFKYKKTKPDVFLKCIRQQNEVYHKTWIIKIEGITEAMMKYIEQDILNIKGVLHIVPSKRNVEIGEWKVLVDQAKCSYIHRQLTSAWSTVVTKIPPTDLTNAPRNFSTPRISSKRARDYQDEDNDDDSYGSLLTTGTDSSVLTVDESILNELPPDLQYPSYASVIMGTPATQSSVQMSSPTDSAHIDWQAEKQVLESQIKNQAAQLMNQEAQIKNQASLIASIQVDLQEKVTRSQDLEDQLAQAIELAHSRDARYEDMMEKFEYLMQSHSTMLQQSNHAMSAFGTQDAFSPSTPEGTPTKPKSPPAKKANTNSSPHRPIYALFRNPQMRQIQHHHNSTARSHLTRKNQQAIISHSATTAMDTDDDSRQPSPGAKPGGKEE